MEKLECPFTKSEVWEVIKGCGGNKAPGLASINLNFFKAQWYVMKTNVMKSVEDFYKLGKLGHGVIGEQQFTFVQGKLGGFMFKIDFEKAYNNVSWDFLDVIMARMGFGERWRLWIMECVTPASISVLVNGVSY
ncbi:Uncharacterized protein TCM_033426 [Theobroma cacao]|uniref:Reverse transcriptase domain-containing protein n=1 Tax=Theobroma cacao TaxID=3641 RepID=A0A061FI42_THECC|nr:Uncharacterized protein TCM_033426 [Theobroma cacao]